MPKKKKGKKKEVEKIENLYTNYDIDVLISIFNKVKGDLDIIREEYVNYTMGKRISNIKHIKIAGKSALDGLNNIIHNLENNPSKLEEFREATGGSDGENINTLKLVLEDISEKYHVLLFKSMPEDQQTKYMNKPESISCFCGRPNVTFKKCGLKVITKMKNYERQHENAMEEFVNTARNFGLVRQPVPQDLGDRSKTPLREPEPEAYRENLTAEEQEAINEEEAKRKSELYRQLEEKSQVAEDELMEQLEQEKRKKEKKKEKNTKKKLRKKEERSAKLLQSLARRRLAKRDLELRMEEKNKKNIATSILDDIVGDVVDKEQVRSVLDDIVGDVVDKEQVRSVLDDIVGDVVDKEQVRPVLDLILEGSTYSDEDDLVENDPYMEMVRDEESAIRQAVEDSQMEYNPVIAQEKIEELQKIIDAKDEQITQLSNQFDSYSNAIFKLRTDLQDKEQLLQQYGMANSQLQQLLQQSNMANSQLQQLLQQSNMANSQLQQRLSQMIPQ